jgi:zinc protease
VLQSRLLDAIREELGGTYSITASPDADKFPRPRYRVRIDWTCDPARTATLVQRVFEEIGFLKSTRLTSDQMTLLRGALLREFEANSQDNGYLLDEISRRYADGDAADLAAVANVPERIGALTANAIQRAAQTYLNTESYVKVTLMPELK